MKDNTKTALTILVGVAVVAAFTAIFVFGAKMAQRIKQGEDAPLTSESSVATSFLASGLSNGNTSSTSSGSTSSGPVVTTAPTLKGSTQKITFNTIAGQTDLPSESFVVALSGLPDSASELDKQLFITCDDDTLDTWLKLTVVRNGAEVTLKSPYQYSSGESVKVTLLRNDYDWTKVGQFYKLPLIIYATNYPDAYWLVDVYIYTD